MAWWLAAAAAGAPTACGPGQDAEPVGGADAGDAGRDVGGEDAGARCDPDALPYVARFEPSVEEASRAALEAGGLEVRVTVEASCFAPPIDEIAVITAAPRVTLGRVEDPPGGRVVVTLDAAALASIQEPEVALGVRVRARDEVLSEERLATLTLTEP